eukprot:jgi/Mesvir1/20284/Mv19893-RA.1
MGEHNQIEGSPAPCDLLADNPGEDRQEELTLPGSTKAGIRQHDAEILQGIKNRMAELRSELDLYLGDETETQFSSLKQVPPLRHCTKASTTAKGLTQGPANSDAKTGDCTAFLITFKETQYGCVPEAEAASLKSQLDFWKSQAQKSSAASQVKTGELVRCRATAAANEQMFNEEKANLAGTAAELDRQLAEVTDTLKNVLECRKEALHKACVAGRLHAVKLLVAAGDDLNNRDKAGRTALALAAGYGHLDILCLLLSHGADKDAKLEDPLEHNALHLAAFRGRLDVVRHLLEHEGMDAKARADGSRDLLFKAAEGGQLEVVRFLLEEKDMDVEAKDDHGMSVLHLAAEGGHLAVIQYLLQEKAMNLDAMDKYDRTPLRVAAEGGQVDTVKYLLEDKKMCLDSKDRWERSLLHLAATGYHMKTVARRAAILDPSSSTETQYASGLERQLELVKYLVEDKGMEVGAKQNEGCTPLQLARREGRDAVVAYLREKEA